MNETKIVIRASKTRKYLGFILFILIGLLTLILQGIIPEFKTVRVELFLLVVIYVGIYKSPGVGVLLTLMLGLMLDLYSGAVVGEGVFCSFFVMGFSRVLSRMIYADRLLVIFFITLTVCVSVYIVLAVITLLWGRDIGTFGSYVSMTFFSSLLTSVAGLFLLPLIKHMDPERGGYYLTRFMPEEWGEPLV